MRVCRVFILLACVVVCFVVLDDGEQSSDVVGLLLNNIALVDLCGGEYVCVPELCVVSSLSPFCFEHRVKFSLHTAWHYGMDVFRAGLLCMSQEWIPPPRPPVHVDS
jgi:hypothetical protein